MLYEYLINQHLIAMLVDFILEKESPLKLGPKKHSMGNKFNNVDFSSGVKIIHWVLQRVSLSLFRASSSMAGAKSILRRHSTSPTRTSWLSAAWDSTPK